MKQLTCHSPAIQDLLINSALLGVEWVGIAATTKAGSFDEDADSNCEEAGPIDSSNFISITFN